jgi:hypothetical protein
MQKTEGNVSQSGWCASHKPCQLLAQPVAEKILGQPVRLTNDTSELKGDIRQCSCVYTGVSKDPATGQDINLYFSVEQKEGSPSAEQAHRVMETTKNENSHDTVIKDLSGIGDEAFKLGDEPNVHFIMARKGPVVIRLQIKQATQKASLEELKTFARDVSKRF